MFDKRQNNVACVDPQPQKMDNLAYEKVILLTFFR